MRIRSILLLPVVAMGAALAQGKLEGAGPYEQVSTAQPSEHHDLPRIDREDIYPYKDYDQSTGTVGQVARQPYKPKQVYFTTAEGNTLIAEREDQGELSTNDFACIQSQLSELAAAKSAYAKNLAEGNYTLRVVLVKSWTSSTSKTADGVVVRTLHDQGPDLTCTATPAAVILAALSEPDEEVVQGARYVVAKNIEEYVAHIFATKKH